MYIDGKPVNIFYDIDGNLVVPDKVRYDREGDRILSDEEQFWGFHDACVMSEPINKRRKFFSTQEQYEKWCEINGQPISE